MSVVEAFCSLVECAYCGWDAEGGKTPAPDDDDAWEGLAQGHAENCEWIDTRAFRREGAE